MDPVGTLLDQITETLPEDRQALRRLKARVASGSGEPLIRNDRLLARYRLDVQRGLRPPSQAVERILTLNGIRSQSGIATVTVITEPYPCPGRCVYCPTEAQAPKSYLTNEPAVRRALRNAYDPYRQVASRLQALDETGHPIDKIDLIVKGGTWSFYPDAYQQEFIRRCFEAANEFGEGSRVQGEGGLEEVQRLNETATSRLIGITIETRPDYINEAQIHRLRQLGVTRVELGVQSLDERILELIVRDHTTAQIRAATRLLRDAGFKVAHHLMPNLPGATPHTDLETMRELFDNPAYRPDAIKLYPCVVLETAELLQWWRQGRYQPYDDQTLVELLIQMKQLAPPYTRIERVIRDIPSDSIRAGSRVTNLREEVHRRMRERGLRCRCIRCRQVRGDAAGTYTLRRRTYQAGEGLEVFLSFEDAASDRLASLLRLRIPSPTPQGQTHWLPVLEGAALIRELHTYGRHVPLHRHPEDAVQHQGFGWRLLQEAERIARDECGRRRMAVIAGVGVRGYYQRLGYTLQDTYMIKALT